jgi:uncharacterized sulfatase
MSKRRVVFIMTDTQGANCVGCYDERAVGTPRIDRLAEQGLRFHTAYTSCPVCSPARGTLFTGLYPHSNGVWANELALGRDTWTLGQRLTDAGIHAAYTGKWHLSATDYFDTGQCPPGWDERYWYDGRNYLQDCDSDEERLWTRQYHTPEEIRKAGFTRDDTFAAGVTDRARGFLREHGEEEFCLVVSYDEPHHPSIAPPPFCDMHQDYEFEIGPGAWDDLQDKPAHHRHWADVHARDGAWRSGTGERQGRYHVPAYFACNSFVDDEIGKVIDAVDRHAPDALVIYTSDHGEMMWAHRISSKGPVMYEQITRIPFIVRGPDVPAGLVDRDPVGHVDVVPTILDYLGADRPPILQGRSLLPRLRGEEEAPDEPVFIEFNRHNVGNHSYGGFKPIRCAVDGRYKLVLNLLHTDELYDLEADPHELENRIEDADLAPVRDRLHEALLEWMDRVRDPFRGPEWRYRPWAGQGKPAWPKGRAHRPLDGYHDPVLGYNTGLPVE